MRMRSQSPPASGPRLSRTAFEIPSRPRSWTRPARRSVRISGSGMPSRSPAAPASSATARAWPRKYGDLRSTKFATARSAASKRSPETTIASAGSAAITASQVPSVSRSDRITSASASITSDTAGSNCSPRRSRASSFAASDAADAVRHLDELGGLRKPRGHGDVLPAPARRASRARPSARTTRRGPRAPAPGAPAARRGSGPSRRAGRSSRRPRGGPRGRTRARAGSAGAGSGRPRASAVPTRADRMLLSSWSYLPAFMAMSSPNHFACSCASEWQPTLMSSAV